MATAEGSSPERADSVGKVVSGWGVNGVTTFQSGFPLKLGTSVNLTNSFGGGSMPNVVPGCASKLSGSAEAAIEQVVQYRLLYSASGFYLW